MVSLADNSTSVLLHELGHVMGMPHIVDAVGTVYPGCGGYEYPPLPTDPCQCERHPLIQLTPDDPDGCPPCDQDGDLSFDSPTYGAVSKHIVDCWLSRIERCEFRWNDQGDPITCAGTPGAIDCVCPGATPESGPTFTIDSCDESTLEQRRAAAAAACGITECEVAGRPDIHCAALSTASAMPCECPNGTVLTYPGVDCAGMSDATLNAMLCQDPPREECTEQWGPDQLEISCGEWVEGFMCGCPLGVAGVSFETPSCAPEASSDRLAAAEAACGLLTCEIAGRPDILCEGFATWGEVACQCPDGPVFHLQTDCTGADFAPGVQAACDEP